MKQLKFGIILNYTSVLLTFVIGLVYTPFLIRTLGQEEYGIYALAFSIAGYLSLLDLGVGNSIVRFIAANSVNGSKSKESRIIGFFFKMFIFIALLTIFLGFMLAININNIVSVKFDADQIINLRNMIIILTINFSLSFIFTTFGAVIQAYERFVFLKLCTLIRTILTPLISVFILLYIPSLELLTLVLLIVNIGVFIVHLYYYRKNLDSKISFEKLNIDFKKEIFRYASIIFIVTIADKFYWSTDQILLGILESPKEVAIFAVAIQFVNIFVSLSLAITNVFLPKITKIVNNENYDKTINHLYLKISKLQTFIVGLAFSGFIVLGKPFIVLWVGESFELVYIITIILMSTFFIDLIQNLGLTIMQAKGKYKFRAYILIICSFLNVLVSIPIIKNYGLLGTAIVTGIFVLLGNVIIMNVYFHKVIGLNMITYWRVIGRLLFIISIVMLLTSILYSNIAIDTWFKFFKLAIFYFSVYSASIFLFFLSKKEKLKIVKVFRSVFLKKVSVK